ncbi:mersacidin family lantibiotic [Clostridium beijerinckii]|uniref:mersacidin family lantibiotic n=1 Tax=Clostridium beijerinckii TaxID=1520 RepID=UPI0015703C29|nr:mersacidin family lantibiotic [Clostridium beijerinckii]NRT74865.1 type 2 lantibiotic (TIGR03893 family) [Clostridium beijerinckii]
MSNLNPVGPSFEELTLEEMAASQGSGDVKAETTMTTVHSSAFCVLTTNNTISTVSTISTISIVQNK